MPGYLSVLLIISWCLGMICDTCRVCMSTSDALTNFSESVQNICDGCSKQPTNKAIWIWRPKQIALEACMVFSCWLVCSNACVFEANSIGNRYPVKVREFDAGPKGLLGSTEQKQSLWGCAGSGATSIELKRGQWWTRGGHLVCGAEQVPLCVWGKMTVKNAQKTRRPSE